MFNPRKYKNVLKDGIVVVSISNLFHLLDFSRNNNQEESSLLKPNTHNFISSEQSALKDKETVQNLKTANNELETESKMNENVIEESKDFIVGKDSNENNNGTSRSKTFKKLQSVNLNKRMTGIKFVEKIKKKKCCDYFTNVILCNFLLLISNSCILWIFCYMFSAQKNESYCYNHHSKEFELCIHSEFCPSWGNHDFIYINDDNLSDVELKKEVNNINNKYLMFYNYESKIFSRINKKFIKTENTLSKYSATIILTKNENYLFNNKFRVGCETYLLGILIMFAISSTIGIFFFGLLSDIFGRKNILISANICEIAGGLILFLTTYFISKYDKEEEFKQKFNEDLKNIFSKYFNESSSFYDIYISNYIEIKNEVLKTRVINNNFKDYNILIFFSIFLIFSSNSSIKIISLSYMLENALTEEKVMLYYLFFTFSQPISILLTTIMVLYTDSFEYPILICIVIIFIITIIFIIFFFESQRFNFEYCFYTKITEFTEYILGKDELKRNYGVKNDEKKGGVEQIINEKENMNYFGILYSTDDYRIQSELNNEKINNNTNILDTFKYNKKSFYQELYRRKIINQYKSKTLIERFYIYQSPLYIVRLIFKNKHIQKKLNILISFIICISIVINLPLQRVTSNYLFGRDKLVSLDVFINYLFLCLILIFIILFPFVHYLTKCFGIYAVLFPFLALIIIGTFFFELICYSIGDDGFVDLTIYDDVSNRKVITYGINYLLPNVFIITISIFCLDYVFYFTVIKLTKTIYRCTALSLAQVLYNLSFIIGIGLEKYLDSSYYFTGIFSVIAFINSFFINSSEDSLNISEIREIKYDENKHSDK